jgi:ribosomal protein S18 acetylase RimI-like enzyme
MSKSGGGCSSGGGSSKSKSKSSTQTITKTKARTMGSVDDQKLIVLRAALFDAAGADVDCLAPFKAFSALKLSDEETVTVAFSTGKTLPRERMKQCFNMSKAHMEGVYDSSEYGWDDDDKKSELKDASSRLLVATNAAGELVGFVAFIMTLQGELYEKPIGEPCMLVRDMQVAPAYQRRGVGRHLMRLCEMIGMKFQLGYVEALVTRDNAAAHAFFTSKAKGYSTEGRDFLDELDGDWDDDSFVVYSKCVSKALKHAAKIQAQQAKEAESLMFNLSAALSAGVSLTTDANGKIAASPPAAKGAAASAAKASPTSLLDAAAQGGQ